MKFGGIIAPQRLKCPHLLSIGVLVAMRVPWLLASALLLLAACLPADSQVFGGGVPDPDALLEFLNSSAFVGIVDKYSGEQANIITPGACRVHRAASGAYCVL
jgi:hypothetical protein